ncbi:MAG: DUF928 domain-containing protein [Cyanobacteria bacterium J06632_22]
MDNCDRNAERERGDSPIRFLRPVSQYVGVALVCGSTFMGAAQANQVSLPADSAAQQAVAPVALSEPSSQIRWRPNPDRGTASSTLSGGRRGGLQSSCVGPGADVALLVPAETEGLVTTQAQPTVAWHVDTDQPVQLELVLSHPEQANPVYTKSLTVTQTDTIQVTLPELELDTRYRWTVFWGCDTQQPVPVHARSFIQRVDFVPADLTPTLSALDQARVYAAAGIWYDAYAALLKNDPLAQHPETQALVQQLLAQANPNHPLVVNAP